MENISYGRVNTKIPINLMMFPIKEDLKNDTSLLIFTEISNDPKISE